MRSLTLIFCLWILLGPVAWASPAEDFAARGKELLASQALGYKIGQLKIRQLRTGAKKAFGANFDLRAFRDEVLKNGALPMSVLETHLKGWVAKGKGA